MLVMTALSCHSPRAISSSDTDHKQFGVQTEYLPHSTSTQKEIIHGEEIGQTPRILTISKDQYKSWSEVPFNDPDIDIYQIEPGDYRDWGFLKINSKNVKDQPKSIRNKAFKEIHPANMNSEDLVLLEGFAIKKSDYWTLQGLTIRGKTGNNEGKYGGLPNPIHKSEHITIDNCVIEEVVEYHFIQIENSSYCIISNCVIRNKIEGIGTGDIIGVYIKSYGGVASLGNVINGCEIYNVTDGVQLMDRVNKAKPNNSAEYPRTRITDNEIYITDALYRFRQGVETACAENGIDIKSGTKSTNPEDRILIEKNVIYGYRKSNSQCAGSSWGSAIVIHMNAQNVVVQDNIIADCNRGISVSNNQNIWIENNLIKNMHSDKDKSSGMAIACDGSAEIWNNTIMGNRIAVVKNGNGVVRMGDNIIFDNGQDIVADKSSTNRWRQENIIADRNGNAKSQRSKRALRSMGIDDIEIKVNRITQPKRRLISIIR